MLIQIIAGIIILILAIIWINWSKKEDKAIRISRGNWIRTKGRR
ncbi:MAG: hypothetical protein AABX54_03295 [Nanoarchaeota archaeon]